MDHSLGIRVRGTAWPYHIPFYSHRAPLRTAMGPLFPCAIISFRSHKAIAKMTARILDGAKIRDEIFAELSREISRLSADGLRPGLAAVLVGENPASQLYVKSKIAACEDRGLARWRDTPPAPVA